MSARPLIAALLSLLLTVCSWADERPARQLPLPLALGGHPGLFGPSPGAADLAAHLRGTMLFGTERPDAPALALRWGLGASVSLWRWAEAGVRFSGRWDLEMRQHLPGPTELWVRAGPPRLGTAALQAVLEHAAGRGGFDEGGRLWTSTTNLGAAIAARPWRFTLTGSLTYERASDDGVPTVYQGLRAGAGIWFSAAKAGDYLGLDVGGDALVRVGGTEGPRGPLDVAAVFAVGLRLVSENGAAFRAGYGQGYGAGMPSRFGLAGVGWSYGRGYLHQRTTPALLDQLWDWLGERWTRRAAPGFGPLWLPPPAILPGGPAAAAAPPYCELLQGLPARALPWVSTRSCFAAWSSGAAGSDAPTALSEVAGTLFYGATGLACGIAEGLVPLFRCFDPRNTAFTLAQGIGQAGAGLGQILLGGGGQIAGASLDATGVGALVGVPAQVISGAVAANGARALASGVGQLISASSILGRPWSWEAPRWPQQEPRPGGGSEPRPGGGSEPRPGGSSATRPGPIEWVPETATMDPAARAYQEGAAGARPGEAPSLVSADGRRVRFDGVDAQGRMIERKGGITMTDKMRDQLRRQSEALGDNARRAI